MFRGSQRWWIRIHEVIYGPSEMFWANDPFSILRNHDRGLSPKRSFVLISPIDRLLVPCVSLALYRAGGSHDPRLVPSYVGVSVSISPHEFHTLEAFNF